MSQTIAQLSIKGVGSLQLGFAPDETTHQPSPAEECGVDQPPLFDSGAAFSIEPGYTILTINPLEGDPYELNLSEEAGKQILAQFRANGGQPFTFGLFNRWYEVAPSGKRHPGEFILFSVVSDPDLDGTNVVGVATHWEVYEVSPPWETNTPSE